MENLPAYFFQPDITDFTTVNSSQYNRSCRYLSAYPVHIRDAIFKGHQASPCQNVEVIFLRGMPGQGKTYYCDTTIKPEQKLRQRHVKIISANLLAARAQAQDDGIQLTDENKNQLTFDYYLKNAHRERKEVTYDLHKKARDEMEHTLFEYSQTVMPASEPLTLVIDNRNIRSFELASYLAIAIRYAVPKENMSIIEVSPLDNKKFLQLLGEKLKEKKLKLSEQTTVAAKKWSELIFERSSEQGSHTNLVYPANSSSLVQAVLCEALASMASVKEDYVAGRLKSYFDNNQSMTPGLLTSEATEMGR
ncbi:hypothetical protein [Endozoicomonas sp. YOMI1]|uniref:hypothetical protein n=1 Tax=Endozoicomonas sp. YOMI1 TaxID=2828739 RepID=UPI0021492244|nr:hypothetical protein [Endozoicomonas sp. YOMI1]